MRKIFFSLAATCSPRDLSFSVICSHVLSLWIVQPPPLPNLLLPHVSFSPSSKHAASAPLPTSRTFSPSHRTAASLLHSASLLLPAPWLCSTFTASSPSAMVAAAATSPWCSPSSPSLCAMPPVRRPLCSSLFFQPCSPITLPWRREQQHLPPWMPLGEVPFVLCYLSP
jgi:hypothetical protein